MVIASKRPQPRQALTLVCRRDPSRPEIVVIASHSES
jgi:hypothetical protein